MTFRRYERQSKETVSDAMKVAALMKPSPMSARPALRTAGTQTGSNHDRAKKFIRDFSQSQFYAAKGEVKADDPGGPAPMDAGAL